MDEIEKQKILNQASELIEEYERLDIIYIRVSTNDKGQDEEDQLPHIINTFNLDKDRCIIIQSKESAYQKTKQKTRDFQIIEQLISMEEYLVQPLELIFWRNLVFAKSQILSVTITVFTFSVQLHLR